MSENNSNQKEHSPSWKIVLVFGILGIIWFFIENSIDSLVLSISTIGVFFAIIIASIFSAVKDYKCGFKKSALLCIPGILLQIASLALYVIFAIKSILSLFSI